MLNSDAKTDTFADLKPDVAIVGANAIATWLRDGVIMVATSTNYGATWANMASLSLASIDPPHIAAGSNGAVWMIVYTNSSSATNVAYSNTFGSSWATGPAITAGQCRLPHLIGGLPGIFYVAAGCTNGVTGSGVATGPDSDIFVSGTCFFPPLALT